MSKARAYFPYYAAAVLALSACTIGPDYTSPAINAPAQFVSQEVIATLNKDAAGNSPALDWWTGFEDDILNQLVEKSLAENFEVAAAMARIKEAEANVRLAASGDNLSADLGISGGVQENRALNGAQDSSTQTSAEAGLGLGLPLDVFGRTRRTVEAAEANLEAARADLKSTVLFISTDIASEYLQLRGNQRQLELLRESVELQEKTLSIVKSRFEAGLSPELDLRRAETSVENLRADIPPLEESLQNSRNRIAGLTGAYPGAYETLLSAARPSPRYDAPIPEALPLDVLTMRPDIRAAEASLKQAVANIGVAETAFYPALSLSGSLTIGATGISSLPASQSLVAALSALIEQAITDGGARSANLDIAQARAEEQLALYEQSLREAAYDVESVLAALQSSARRQSALQNAVHSSQRSFSQAETLYQQGLISFLDVVDAQRSLASAEQALAREQTNYATQIALLFRALGVDVKTGPAEINPD